MPGPIYHGPSMRPRYPFNQPAPLVDNGPPATPQPGPTDHIYMWEAQTSNVVKHRFGGSCRGSQVLIPVGKCRMSPPMIGWKEESTTLHFVWCFGVGPAASIANWEISGKAEGDILPAVMTTKCSANYKLGTNTQTALSYCATTIWGGGADAPRFRNLIVAGGVFYKPRIGDIGLPTLQADVTMQSWDFREGTPAYTTNENPVLALYTYMVKNPWGPRVPSTEIDTTSWGDAADWCDDDMDSGGGTQKRWRAGGVLDGGDVTSVVQTFLQAAWCTMAWVDGKWYLVPFLAQRSSLGDYTALTADYIKRRRLGYSRRPAVVHVNYRDAENDYLDKQAIARSTAAIAGTARWITRTDSPPLINAEDTARRYAETLLRAVSDNNRATVKVNHKDNPAVLDVRPGDQVRLSTWKVDAGTGADDLWRVESINHQELVSELELLGDEDALAVTLNTNTTGGTRTRLTTASAHVINDAIQGVDASENIVDLLQVGTAPQGVIVGDTDVPATLRGSAIAAIPALTNAVALTAKETGGTARDLIVMNASNKVAVSGANNDVTIRNGVMEVKAAEVALTQAMTSTSDITLENNKHFYIKDLGGTPRSIANVNASSAIYIGPGVGGGDLMIQADGITLSCPYGAKDLGDIGSETNSTNIDAADGDIHQIGTAEISNLTRVTTPEFRGKLWRGTMEKALTDNSAINLIQWNGTTGKSAALMIFYECRVEYTQIAGTKYLIESGIITARMTNYSGTVTLGAEKALNNQTNSGTGAMTVTVGTGNGTDYGRVTFNCDLTSGTWVDGEVRYTVINTDTDYSSLTLFG